MMSNIINVYIINKLLTKMWWKNGLKTQYKGSKIVCKKISKRGVGGIINTPDNYV